MMPARARGREASAISRWFSSKVTSRSSSRRSVSPLRARRTRIWSPCSRSRSKICSGWPQVIITRLEMSTMSLIGRRPREISSFCTSGGDSPARARRGRCSRCSAGSRPRLRCGWRNRRSRGRRSTADDVQGREAQLGRPWRRSRGRCRNATASRGGWAWSRGPGRSGRRPPGSPPSPGRCRPAVRFRAASSRSKATNCFR